MALSLVTLGPLFRNISARVFVLAPVSVITDVSGKSAVLREERIWSRLAPSSQNKLSGGASLNGASYVAFDWRAERC